MKQTTVTIGIAAFNEEHTITSLLTSLLSQTQKSFFLDAIIVVSDGSNDNTIATIKKVKNKKIIIRDNKTRQGKAISLNHILKESSSDILVCIDADVTIKDKLFLEKLLKPIISKHIDVAAAKVMELLEKNEFQKILSLSMKIKKEIFENYNNGENIYTCHGRTIAMSKKIYKKIHFPKGIIADDAYIYLFAKAHGFTYQYVKEAKVYYMLPQTLEDHNKQSHRFLSTQKQLYAIFGEMKTKNEYHLPVSVIIKTLMRYAIKHPLTLFQYVTIYSKSKIRSFIDQPSVARWETAHSSKTV